jgi:hypothetical protein
MNAERFRAYAADQALSRREIPVKNADGFRRSSKDQRKP